MNFSEIVEVNYQCCDRFKGCDKSARIPNKEMAYDHLRCHYLLPHAEELVKLMARPHMKSLLLCHDAVANKAYEPKLREIPFEVDEDDICVKV
ncbi:unnamed protein product [Protopolystoma xenopodis]|uniref:L27 domain-containing protein n=1 Tax=Protopolystoma xenopodis TaxID=117903 RepID=A0A448WD62_9PLAT|nr:unnamed protein product [Protopolystoma xenopodis]